MVRQHKEDTEGHKIARKDIGNQCKCRCRCMLLDSPVGAWGILMDQNWPRSLQGWDCPGLGLSAREAAGMALWFGGHCFS